MINSKKGFTLVEVMIVVAIIALLATLAIPGLLRARIEANNSSAKAALKAISTALETYSFDAHRYPPDTTSLLGVNPPYLNVDYFTGSHHGFTFTSSLALFSYSATAIPNSSRSGSGSFTISTGGLLVEN